MAMVRYLILRTLIFIGCLAATYLLGLRSREQMLLAVVIAAVASMIISAFVLRPFRQQASADIANRVDSRVARKQEQRAEQDEAVEDAEIEQPGTSSPQARQSAQSPSQPGDDTDFR